MATKKELLQAQAFSRRRLLTAFSSGIPSGKELEPIRPMRSVIAGLALAVLIVLAGLGFGLISPGLPQGWENNMMLVTKESGARFVTSNGTLYPVINTTSARLIIPPGKFKANSVAQSQITDLPRGESVGIPGAPDDLPAPSRLVRDSWFACTVASQVNQGNKNGVHALVGGDGQVKVTDRGLIVSLDSDPDAMYLIAGGMRYPVRAGEAPGLVRALGLTSRSPEPVSTTWLNLFAEGSALAPIDLPKAGEALPNPVYAGRQELHVGDAVRVVDAPGGDQVYVLTEDSTLGQLTPFATAMWLFGGVPGERRVVDVAPSEVGSLGAASGQIYPDDWPKRVSDVVSEKAVPCAIMKPGKSDGSPTVSLGTASKSPEESEAPRTVVPRGKGALVRSVNEGDTNPGSVFVLDDLAKAYGIPKANSSVIRQLGYQTSDIRSVPASWLALFDSGPMLDAASAGKPSELASRDPKTTEPAAQFTRDGPAPGTECQAGRTQYINRQPSGLRLLQADRVKRIATGKGVLVAVVDSGVSGNNAHLTPALDSGKNLINDETDGGGWQDLMGHGTAIAGVIAARPVKGSGVIGLAPDARILPIRVFSGKGQNDALDPDLIAQGIRDAADAGSQIINVSLSSPDDSPPLRSAVEFAQSHGALVVASSGNVQGEGEQGPEATSQIRYPAGYKGVLGVSALDSKGFVTDASVHGPHVDLAAPGQAVLTTYLDAGDCYLAADAPSSSYATGYVSAAAALVAEEYPNEGPSMWAYRLTASASRPSLNERNDASGWGTVQPFEALTTQSDGTQPGPVMPGTKATAARHQQPDVVTHPVDRSLPQTRLAIAVLLALSAGVVIVFVFVGLNKTSRSSRRR